MPTGDARTFPHGVTCWIDTEQPDVDAAIAFYGDLFGWTFTEAMPPGAPGRYTVAALEGRDVAAIGGGDDNGDEGGEGGDAIAWHTYVAVDDCDGATEHLAGLGAQVTSPPADAGPGGRTSTLSDPEGASIRLWRARRRLGVQVANQPGAWNFSDLHARDPQGAATFYGPAFGWVIEDQGWATSIRVPGYGAHLESSVDPDIRTRQAGSPEGFADVIGAIVPAAEGEAPHWHVTFTVADRDETAALVERLGGTVLWSGQDAWTRRVLVRDPQGAQFTASQFAPQER